MHWSDAAIVLSARKHGENSAVLRVLTRNHGVYAGVIRGAHSKANRGILQPGNILNATWQARLSEQLGTFKAELLQATAVWAMADAGKLSALASACALLESALPERHPYPRLYRSVQFFLEALNEEADWPAAYVRLELEILAESGFGLDLRACAATGATHDLIYVSPKSGRAVSRQAGEPYKDRLLPLPGFLLSPPPVAVAAGDILAGLRLTEYFLEHWLLAPHRRKLPAARRRLLEATKAWENKKVNS